VASVVPVVVASRARAVDVAALVTHIGAVVVRPGSVGMTAGLLELAILNLAGLMARYRCPREDVQDGIFIALPLIAVYNFSSVVKLGGSVAVEMRGISRGWVLKSAEIFSMEDCVCIFLNLNCGWRS